MRLSEQNKAFRKAQAEAREACKHVEWVRVMGPSQLQLLGVGPGVKVTAKILRDAARIPGPRQRRAGKTRVRTVHAAGIGKWSLLPKRTPEQQAEANKLRNAARRARRARA